MELNYRPVALIILDGWGYNPNPQDNAVAKAKKPFLDQLFATCPHSMLLTSGEAVGLPEGQMGTSEVGHLNIGAGRVVYQSLVRISKALREHEMEKNPVFMEQLRYAVDNGRPLHLMGLVSPGGVHSHTDHLYGFIELAKQHGVKEVFIHAFLDGRDTPPASAKEYIQDLMHECERIGLGKIATISGRYYAMDRDKRWERVEKAYLAMVDAVGEQANDPIQAVEQSYQKDVTDEFVLPTVILNQGRPVGTVQSGDPVIFFNFRPDRAREITRAFVDENFDGFKRKAGWLKPKFACLTQYDETINAPVIFPPEKRMENILGEYLSKLGLKQLRIAETEKYAHVTFFFNGGEEKPFPGEERILIPSPKVATYDMKPEMSAYAVTDAVEKAIEEDKFDVIIMNYANCDMVGHTGVESAAVRAVEAVDECLSRIIPAMTSKGGAVLICADHGNAEEMVDPVTGEPCTSHTTNPVPLVLCGLDRPAELLDGSLADLAPTVLELLGVEKPKEMTGKSLVKFKA